MGNEFGHPEWIDFPREGNGWSYKYARRQWDLVDREELKYKFLGRFDHDMIHLVSSVRNFQATPVEKLWDKDDDQVLAFKRGDLVFVFNFNPSQSFTGYDPARPALHATRARLAEALHPRPQRAGAPPEKREEVGRIRESVIRK